MHPRPDDRGHIDDAALRLDQVVAQALRQQDRGEEIDVEDVQPVLVGHLQAGDLAAVGMLWRDRGVVDQRVQPPAGDPLDLRQCIPHYVDIRQVELDVVALAARPRTARIERLAGDRQHAPAGAAEALDGGVTDAAAGAGQTAERVVAQG